MMAKRRADITHWADDKVRKRHNPFREVSASILHNYEMELSSLIGACDKERARLLAVKAMVQEALVLADGPEQVVIADHAIVRYLERYEGFDTGRVEAAIAEMLENGRDEVAIRDGIVITILPEGCASRPTESA